MAVTSWENDFARIRQDSSQGPMQVALMTLVWERTDDAILWLRSNLIVRLELPAAREHEVQLKARKEQKARASVPSF